jgi:WD40 repeat protein
MSEISSTPTHTSAPQLRLVLAHFSDSFSCVAWSPDGSLLASSSSNATARLWDVASGQLRRTLEGHTASVESVAWAPDEHTLASGAPGTGRCGYGT